MACGERIVVEADLDHPGKIRTFVTILVGLCLFTVPVQGDDLNWLDWSAIAPEIVVAKILGKEGRSIVAVTETVLKGDRSAGDEFLIHLRTANRNRMSHEPILRLLHGETYLLLLESTGPGENYPKYILSRGVRGARELPREGASGIVSAIEEFLAIHGLEDYDKVWERHEALLESTNPIVIEAMLSQFTKFRRGTTELIPTVMPLMSHPIPGIRAGSASLLGQILEETAGSAADVQPAVPGELIAMARGDNDIPARMAAIRAVAWIPGDGTQTVLEEISRKDPDQLVRYTAQKILLVKAEEGAARH
jgi:hypothetical protein